MRSHALDGTASQAGGLRWRIVAGLLAALAVSGGATAGARAASCPGADRIPLATTTDEAATATLCVINRERARRDLPRLRSHAELQRAGRRYARDMVRRQFFSHTSPTGSTMVDRLQAVGYADPDRAWSIGEALAWGAGTRGTPAAIVSAWLASRSHRRLLLDSEYRDIGIGIATGTPFARDDPGGTYAAELGVHP